MLLGLFSQVGFFPAECVEVIGDKIPASVQSMVPLNSNSKKPCRHASHYFSSSIPVCSIQEYLKPVN